MSSEIAIKVENLSKCYQIYNQPRDRLKQFVLPRLRRLVGLPPKQYFREFWALKDVSFEVKKGETVGIIGRNGSGKSTLLQMICGTLNPTSGSMQTQGRIAALLELGSGFNPEFTGRENVYMNGAVLGLSKNEIDARFDDIVAFADIGQFIEQPVKTYSSGMVVRLAFSVAINAEPEILIIDEALSVGDELFQRKCFSRIESIRASGSTILFVSHSGAQIIELCDRAILMDAGQKLSSGVPKRIIGFYHKLLYAPVDKQDEIRRAIYCDGQALDLITANYESSVSDQDLSVELDQQEYFDPGLKPSSTIEYESRGAEITAPSLFTSSGERVNGLLRGERYKYRYKVFFTKAIVNVRFAMAIRTTSGLFIGGAFSASSLSDAIPVVEEGSTINVEFSFNCVLNPEIYFMNAAVFGEQGGDDVVLHRIVDALAFRVIPTLPDGATGHAWFSIDAKLS